MVSNTCDVDGDDSGDDDDGDFDDGDLTRSVFISESKKVHLNQNLKKLLC